MPDRVGLGEYLVGCGLLAAVLAAAAVAAVVVVRRRLPWLRGAPRLLAGALVATLAVMAVHLVPAMLGVLSRGTVLVAAALLGAAVVALVRPAAEAAPAPEAAPSAEPPEGRLSWVLVALAAAVLGAWLLVASKVHATQAIRHVDMLAVYLPDTARLIQRGSIWHNEQFVPLLANGNYPQNGLLLQLATILPFRQDAFARFALYPYAALTVVALYALGRELGAPRTTAWLTGIAFAAIPHVAFLVTQGLADAVLFFGFATGALFLLRAWRTRSVAELLLAGAALGVAFGTKWYGVPAVAVLLGLWLVSRWLRERTWRPPLADAALAGVVVLLTGGVWLVRNLVVTGNPTFPSAVEPLGITLFDAPANELTARFGHTISDYLTEPSSWADLLLPAWWGAWGPFVPLVLLGAVAAFVLGRRRPAIALLAAAVVALLAAYVVTPNSAWGPEGAPILVGANARYALPAVVLAAALTAWVARRAGGGRIALEAVLVAVVVVGVAKAPLDLDAVQVAVGAAVLLAVALAAPRAWPAVSRAWPAFAVGAALLLVVGGRVVQDRHHDQRYARHDAAAAYVNTDAPEGHRIGVAGLEAVTDTSPIYPLFGPRLRNEVEYVGPFVEDLLRTYGTARDFVAALDRGRFDLLMVYRPADPGATAREEAWATRAGFAPVARDDRVTLLERR